MLNANLNNLYKMLFSFQHEKIQNTSVVYEIYYKRHTIFYTFVDLKIKISK